MSERTITLPYGRENLAFNLPEECVEGVFSPNRVEAVGDVGGSLDEALDRPHGCESLRSMLQKRRPERVVIVIDDNTRNTPVKLALTRLLDYCNQSGAPDKHIKVVIALGTHRPMTQDEIVRKAGREAYERVAFVNPKHDCPDDLVSYGASRSGVEISINRTYAEADFKIAVGSIIPHAAVGFSGGAKMIYPGVAGRRTVEQFHRMANCNPENAVGKVDTPVRREIEEMIEMAGLDFLVAMICDSEGKVAGIRAGHYVKAHRAGAELSRTIYGIPLKRRVKTAIASSYPADLDLWQAAKCLFNCHSVVEDGGWLIMATPCGEGIPSEHARFGSYIGTDSRELAKGLERGALPELSSAPPALCVARIRERINVGIVSEGLTRRQVEEMKFHYFSSVKEAIDHVFLHTAKHKIAIFTHGGESFPYVV